MSNEDQENCVDVAEIFDVLWDIDIFDCSQEELDATHSTLLEWKESRQFKQRLCDRLMENWYEYTKYSIQYEYRKHSNRSSANINYQDFVSAKISKYRNKYKDYSLICNVMNDVEAFFKRYPDPEPDYSKSD